MKDREPPVHHHEAEPVCGDALPQGSRCPCLRLQSDPTQVADRPGPGHRCYVGLHPAPVGLAYQAAVCLTPNYINCPRLVGDHLAAPAADRVGAGRERRHLPRTGIPSILPQDGWPEERSQPPATPAATPAPLPVAPAGLQKVRRRVTLVEVTVLGLGLAILFASLFIGYAIVYRLQLRGGVEVAAVMPTRPGPAGEVRPTLVPTFTPTPSPDPSPAVAAGTPPPTPEQPTPLPEPTLPLPTPVTRPPANSPPTRLVIAKLNLDIPVLPVGVRKVKVGGTERVLWADVPNAGGFHQTSAYPGNPGNTVINGHRDILGSVFRHLDKMEVGDEIILYVGEVAYPYLVTEIVVVPETFASAAQRADNLKYIGYIPEERLTLVTCTPIGLATHRLLVIAHPPEQAAPQMPEAGAGAGP